MKHCNRFLKPLAALTAALLLGVFGAPICFAYPFPPVTPIATLNQLIQWYNEPGGGLAQLTQNIKVNRHVEFKPTSVNKEISMAMPVAGAVDYTLHVVLGGELVIDNPKMVLQGRKELITVENGGALELRRGNLWAGVSANTVGVLVRQGGSIALDKAFQMNGSVITDENSVKPPDPPVPPDTRTPITSLYDDKAHISCAVGERPDPSEYPATVYAYFGVVDGADLPVEWELSKVDFTAPKTYSVTGRIAQAALDEKDLSNPQGLTAQMTITVYEAGPPQNMRSEVLSVGAAGNTNARLILPALPIKPDDEPDDDKWISAVYLYHSADGEAWEKATYDTAPEGTVKEESYLSATHTVGENTYIVYKYTTDYRPLWVKAELVGSDRAGMSNAVQLILPEGSKPGDVTSSESSEDAGDSGGNRGGGGQTVEDRTLPPKPDAAQTNTGTQQSTDKVGSVPPDAAEQTAPPPLAATPEEAPPESAAQVLAATNEPQTVPPPEREQKTSIPPAAAAAVALTGGAGLGGWIFLKKRP